MVSFSPMTDMPASSSVKVPMTGCEYRRFGVVSVRA